MHSTIATLADTHENALQIRERIIKKKLKTKICTPYEDLRLMNSMAFDRTSTLNEEKHNVVLIIFNNTKAT